MKPVRVTFTLRTPMVIPPGAKHFDALLSWASVKEAEFNGHAAPFDMQHNIGVAKHTAGSDWCFKAGAIEIDWLGDREKLHYIKRQRIESFADAYMDGLLDKRPYFDGKSGATKAGSYIEPIRWTKNVTAFAIVEDLQRFEELLPWITHIGKLHHKDYGAVNEFKIVEDPLANTMWTRRNLPVNSDAADSHVLMMGGLHSPYWKRENHKPVLTYSI